MWVRRSFHPLLLVAALCTLVFTGCKHQQDVVGNGILQKRKHRPGLHLNLKRIHEKKLAHIDDEKEKLIQRDSSSLIGKAVRQQERGQPDHKALVADRSSEESLSDDVTASRRGAVKGNLPSIRKSADERTETLEELREHQERNKRNLKITGILFSTPLIAWILFNIVALLGIPIAPILGIVFLVCLVLLRYTIPLFIIYLVEYFVLKKGNIFFNDHRIKVFEGISVWAKRIQLIAFVVMILSAVGIVAGLLFFLPLTIWSFVALSVAYVLLLLTSWVGIVASLASRRYSTESAKALFQLIALQITSGLLAIVFLITAVFLIILGVLAASIV